MLGWIRKAREEPLFLGVDHVGIYPTERADARTIGEWYRARLGSKLEEGKASLFVRGTGSGRVEIMKEATGDRCHVAVRVSNFEEAVAALNAQGVELDEPRTAPGMKVVYLKEKDPCGNVVHLVWIE